MQVAERIDPLNIEGLSFEQNRLVEERLERELASWENTPHQAGQQCKGVGVDCVRFVTAVIDDLCGIRTEIKRLPHDIAFHKKDTCFSALRIFLEEYPHEDVTDGILQPGDVLITGPRGGGPGHAVVVGVRHLWHCAGSHVCRTGLCLTDGGVYFLKKTVRGLNRERWVR